MWRKLGANDTCIRVVARFTTISVLFGVFTLWGFGRI